MHFSAALCPARCGYRQRARPAVEAVIRARIVLNSACLPAAQVENKISMGVSIDAIGLHP